jgi:K+-transporting ATPase c subunit
VTTDETEELRADVVGATAVIDPQLSPARAAIRLRAIADALMIERLDARELLITAAATACVALVALPRPGDRGGAR